MGNVNIADCVQICQSKSFPGADICATGMSYLNQCVLLMRALLAV